MCTQNECIVRMVRLPSKKPNASFGETDGPIDDASIPEPIDDEEPLFVLIRVANRQPPPSQADSSRERCLYLTLRDVTRMVQVTVVSLAIFLSSSCRIERPSFFSAT